MMRELGGVFGIAVVVAVFAGAGSYASHRRSSTASSRPSWSPAALAIGALAGLALPDRRAVAVPLVPGPGGDA